MRGSVGETDGGEDGQRNAWRDFVYTFASRVRARAGCLGVTVCERACLRALIVDSVNTRNVDRS